MRWRPLRRAATAYVIAIGTVALLSGGLIGSTFALFTAETTNNASTFAGGWIDPPTLLTPTPSGYTMGLTWVPGTHGPVTGQQLYGVDNANTSSCTGVTYTAIGSAMTAALAAYTDTSRGTAANNGDWFCYQLTSTSATSWTASGVQPVQLGLVATSIGWTDASAPLTPGTLTNGDKLTITFNQKTNLAASGTISVCARTTGGIRIGATAGCSNTIGVNIGVISGGVVGANKNFTSSGFVTTAAAPFTLTITFGGSGGGTPGTSFSGTSTFTGPASSGTSVKSSLTPVAVLCARAVSACQPTTTSLP
jgi:hypothetical protein